MNEDKIVCGNIILFKDKLWEVKEQYGITFLDGINTTNNIPTWKITKEDIEKMEVIKSGKNKKN